MLYKIGDFSKKTSASIRTLRYYDKIGLFRPSEIDLFTGYRYYDDNQVEDFKIVLMLKEADFSLEEIIKYWNNFDESIMLTKKSQLAREINKTKDKIRKVDYLRSNIIKGKIILNFAPEKQKDKEKNLFK